MSAVNPGLIATPTKIRTFEIVCNVNGWLEGGLDDWPAQMQDAVYAALERKAAEVELPLTIVHSYCSIDHGGVEAEDQPYVHIIASEIIAADNRFYQAEKEKLRNLISDIMSGRRTQ